MGLAGQRRWRGAVLILALVPGLITEGILARLGSSQAPLKAIGTPAASAKPSGPRAMERTLTTLAPMVARQHAAAARPRRSVPRQHVATAPTLIPATAPSNVEPVNATATVDARVADAPVVDAAASKQTPAWLDVSINGQQPGIALLLRDGDGHLWVRREDLALWRLPVPQAAPIVYNGDEYYPLDALPGIKYQIDEAAQSVSIDSPARLFPETVVNDRESLAATPDRSQPGAFFNYDVIAARASGAAAAGSTTFNGLFELGAFNRWGEMTSTALRAGQTDDAGLIRLDTTFTQDRPEDLASLRIGDSISGVSSWGGAVHFAGVQWSTDFTTQPGFVTTPLAGIRGEAVLPSTLDLYINNALRLQTTIPPGPFVINDLPVNSGVGEARVVVLNMLGQEQTISVPYYVSPSLLRAGLSSFSYEVGAARDNYGLASNDYGRGLAVATDRHGFTDTFTGEIHAEVLADQQTAGLGGVWLVNDLGVLNAAVAGSHSDRGDGALMQFGFERQWHVLSVGGSVRYAESTFVEIGMLPTDLPPVRVVQGNVSTALPKRGSLSLNYIQEDYRTAAPEHLLSAQASWPVGRRGFLSLSALKPLRGGNGPTFGANFTLTLGSRTSASAGVIRQAGGNEAQLQVQQNLPAGTGMGYRVSAGTGATDQLDATWQYQNSAGTYALQTERINGATSTSFEAQGGVALLNDRLYVSRKLDESFAVVQVGDFANVHIYADNQVVAQTDSSGTALVPRIRAYERNPLGIDQADLPLDVDIDTLQKNAIPYRRSGVLVTFDLHRSLGALVSLVEEDGLPIPVGAVAVVGGNDTEFPVGTKGETYLTGLSPSSVVHVSWPGKACEAKVVFTPSADPLPKLGPLVCQAVAP
jgi:outer membrane usher protein